MTITQKKIVSLHHAKVTILFEMRKHISYNSILAACVLVVLTLCLLSVWQPIHFQKEKEQRETAVKQRLMKIRTAEENYKRRHGTYTGDFATLIKGKWLDREMQYIPFSDNKRFSLSATTIVTKNGKQIPLMECGATYEEYLDGLNERHFGDERWIAAVFQTEHRAETRYRHRNDHRIDVVDLIAYPTYFEQKIDAQRHYD